MRQDRITVAFISFTLLLCLQCNGSLCNKNN